MAAKPETLLPSDESDAASPAAGDPTCAISVRGLTKTYGKRRGAKNEPALKAIDLDVKVGEFLVLLGPSGCGKTTLLRSIAGLERPDEGSIVIGDEVVFDGEGEIDAEQRPVSMIFQAYALWPHMTAAQHVAFPLKCAGVKRAEIPARVDEILTKVGIGQLADRFPGQMSGGQQQRLAFARALVVGQRVMLMDEPLSNVDAQVREKLRLELIKMQRTLGFTAIYVTHDQSEAMELADRIAVMSHGRIAQVGTPREMYESPRDIDVARCLGQTNEIPFEVEQFDERTGRVVGAGAVGTVVAMWHPAVEMPPPAVGESFTAFGRPRDFTIAPVRSRSAGAIDPSTATRENHWLAKIEAVRFLGSHTECVIKIGESRLRCRLAPGSDNVTEGDDVSIGIAAADLHAMRETS